MAGTSGTRDSFQRLRVSECKNVFDYHPTGTFSVASYYDRDIFTTALSSGEATVSYASGVNSLNLAATAAANDYISMQTRVPQFYMSGSSRQTIISAIPADRAGAGSENLTLVMGLCSLTDATPPVVDEGYYLKITITAAAAAYTLGQKLSGASANDIAQASWNINTLESTYKALNASSILAPITLVITEDWSVGKVLMGFMIRGTITYAHEFVFTGTAIATTTPLLPITYLLTAVADVGTSTFTTQQLNSSCCLENNLLPVGRRIGIETSDSGVTLGTTATRKYVVLGLKLKSGFGGILRPLKLSVRDIGEDSSSAIGQYELQLFTSSVGGLNTTPSFTALTDSASEYATGNGTTNYLETEGYIVTSGTVSHEETEITFDSNNLLAIRNMAGENDTFYLFVRASSAVIPNIIVAGLDFLENI